MPMCLPCRELRGHRLIDLLDPRLRAPPDVRVTSASRVNTTRPQGSAVVFLEQLLIRNGMVSVWPRCGRRRRNSPNSPIERALQRDPVSEYPLMGTVIRQKIFPRSQQTYGGKSSSACGFMTGINSRATKDVTRRSPGSSRSRKDDPQAFVRGHTSNTVDEEDSPNTAAPPTILTRQDGSRAPALPRIIVGRVVSHQQPYERGTKTIGPDRVASLGETARSIHGGQRSHENQPATTGDTEKGDSPA